MVLGPRDSNSALEYLDEYVKSQTAESGRPPHLTLIGSTSAAQGGIFSNAQDSSSRDGRRIGLGGHDSGTHGITHRFEPLRWNFDAQSEA
jgi:hypothetical protein